jgi:hypothetical protein
MNATEIPIRAELELTRPLAQCCDAQSTRYALSAVQVTPADAGNVWCAACDSRVLALVKQKGTADGPHLLPGEFAKPVARGTVCASLNGQWTISGRNARGLPDGKAARLVSEGEGRFPRAADVLPDVVGCVQVGISGALLANLAKAIGNESGEFVLFIPLDGESLAVKGAIGVKGEHGIGVIMPVSVGEPSVNQNEYAATVKEFRASTVAT